MNRDSDKNVLGAVGAGAVTFATVYAVASLFVGGAVTPKIHGATSARVTQSTIHSTICVPGYTRTVRPSSRWAAEFKWALADKQGVASHDYELDHLIPLELGGSPRSARNLWLEPWAEAHKSDPVENRLHREVCSGEISLVWAQHEILDYKEKNG